MADEPIAPPAEQENPTLLRNKDQPGILTFIHNIDLPRWSTMDAQEKKTWTAFNLRYMVRQLDMLAAALERETAAATPAATPAKRVVRRRRTKKEV